MSVTSKTIKCLECNVFTTDADYCKNCGALISFTKKQELKEQQIREELIANERFKLENPNWIERLKKHPFWLYKGLGYLLNSVIVVVSIIGSGFAWFIAMIAAG